MPVGSARGVFVQRADWIGPFFFLLLIGSDWSSHHRPPGVTSLLTLFPRVIFYAKGISTRLSLSRQTRGAELRLIHYVCVLFLVQYSANDPLNHILLHSTLRRIVAHERSRINVVNMEYFRNKYTYICSHDPPAALPTTPSPRINAFEREA